MKFSNIKINSQNTKTIKTPKLDLELETKIKSDLNNTKTNQFKNQNSNQINKIKKKGNTYNIKYLKSVDILNSIKNQNIVNEILQSNKGIIKENYKKEVFSTKKFELLSNKVKNLFKVKFINDIINNGPDNLNYYMKLINNLLIIEENRSKIKNLTQVLNENSKKNTKNEKVRKNDDSAIDDTDIEYDNDCILNKAKKPVFSNNNMSKYQYLSLEYQKNKLFNKTKDDFMYTTSYTSKSNNSKLVIALEKIINREKNKKSLILYPTVIEKVGKMRLSEELHTTKNFYIKKMNFINKSINKISDDINKENYTTRNGISSISNSIRKRD